MKESTPPEDRYFDRELSWIEFNARVLAEGMDASNPPLERLKFIGIVSSNFDEFFMVRVAGLEEGSPEALEVYRKAYEVLDRQGAYFQDVLVPELEKAGIVRMPPRALNEKHYAYVRDLFFSEIMPLLTPVAIRAEHPIPPLLNHSIYRAVHLANPKRDGEWQYAVVEIPRNYQRIIWLPGEGNAFILLGDIVSLFIDQLFVGYEVLSQGIIRITRGADLTLDEEKDEDFARVMSEALRMRRGNFIVRFETDAPDEMIDFFRAKLELQDHEIYRVKTWVDLKSISQLAFQSIFADLKRPPWTAKPNADFTQAEDVWELIREKDVLVHHPYESFDAFLRFLDAAADDPDVLAIKQTLYRAASGSAVVRALVRAAEKGKQVTVLVELKARFDEESNIALANRLVAAGATVLYGVAGLKTHSKVCMVVRREAEGIRRYLHLGTGNYNEKTANLYSDISTFTCRDSLAQDISAFFNIITGFSQPGQFSRISVSPFDLRRRLERLILREAMRAREGQKGLIMAKMNSLVDPEIIEALYRVSQAGVTVKLNVRGICCLRPGVKGMSENIEVTSIVDMFLEHSRIFYFRNNGDEEVYLSSADWMPRNLNRRLELMFPVDDVRNRASLIELLGQYFQDNSKSWILQPDGSYLKKAAGEKPFRVQEVLCRQAADRAASVKTVWKEIRPQRPKKG